MCEDMKEICKMLSDMSNSAYQTYSKITASICSDSITDLNEIEHYMDGLLGFCMEERFEKLYKKVCRHVYNRAPMMVSEHVQMWLDEKKLDSEPDTELEGE